MPQRIEELFGVVVEMAAEIRDPFEQSFFLMVHLPYLQPFEDVNKRVSRLAANIPFIQHNLSPLSFLDVTGADYIEGLLGVYELNRIDCCATSSCVRTSVRASNTLPCASNWSPDAVRLRYRKRVDDAHRRRRA